MKRINYRKVAQKLASFLVEEVSKQYSEIPCPNLFLKIDWDCPYDCARCACEFWYEQGQAEKCWMHYAIDKSRIEEGK